MIHQGQARLEPSSSLLWRAGRRQPMLLLWPEPQARHKRRPRPLPRKPRDGLLPQGPGLRAQSGRLCGDVRHDKAPPVLPKTAKAFRLTVPPIMQMTAERSSSNASLCCAA